MRAELLWWQGCPSFPEALTQRDGRSSPLPDPEDVRARVRQSLRQEA
jgi:hypothetical protein